MSCLSLSPSAWHTVIEDLFSMVLLISQVRCALPKSFFLGQLESILHLTRKFSIKQNGEERESGTVTLVGPLIAPNANVHWLLHLSTLRSPLSLFALITPPRRDHIILRYPRINTYNTCKQNSVFFRIHNVWKCQNLSFIGTAWCDNIMGVGDKINLGLNPSWAPY